MAHDEVRGFGPRKTYPREGIAGFTVGTTGYANAESSYVVQLILKHGKSRTA